MNDAIVEFNIVEPELNFNCHITPVGFRNVLPAGTRVTIVEIQAKINYKNGQVETFGPRRVSIAPQGADEVFMSECVDNCPISIWGEMTVHDTQAGRDKTVKLQHVHNATPDRPCIPLYSFALGV